MVDCEGSCLWDVLQEISLQGLPLRPGQLLMGFALAWWKGQWLAPVCHPFPLWQSRSQSSAALGCTCVSPGTALLPHLAGKLLSPYDAGDPVIAHRHYPHCQGGFRAEPERLGIPVQSLSLLCSSLEPDMAGKDLLSQLAVVERCPVLWSSCPLGL